MIDDNASRLLVWVTQHADLPDVCVSCGMFTDRRVTTKHVGEQRTMVESGGGSPAALGCLLMFLGPIGWLISLVINSKSQSPGLTTKVVKVRSKMKIPQCSLCYGQFPAAPQEVAQGRFGFAAHRNFAARFHELNSADNKT